MPRERLERAPGALPPEPASLDLPGEEERIESAKYTETSKRVFEEERFLFPETYGRNRVRLLVKDPQWLFAYWDVDPAELAGLRDAVGERATALSRFTLKVSDVNFGGTSVVLLPEGARSWYVRADETRRSYRAELGITLPSGEFRRLATSNVVTTPRVGPAREGARRVLSYHHAAELSYAEAAFAGREGALSAPGPWGAEAVSAAHQRTGPSERVRSDDEPAERGGASETYRR